MFFCFTDQLIDDTEHNEDTEIYRFLFYFLFNVVLCVADADADGHGHRKTVDVLALVSGFIGETLFSVRNVILRTLRRVFLGIVDGKSIISMMHVDMFQWDLICLCVCLCLNSG